MSFDEFLSKYHLTAKYSSEYETRRALFETEVQNVEKHNNSTSSFKRGINHFSAMSEEEKHSTFGFSKTQAFLHEESPHKLHASKALPTLLPASSLPSHVDWRSAGVVSTIKDQGHCGSCWAFAATATLESHVAIKTGLLNELSPQQFVECAQNLNHCGGTGGCAGSTAELAWDYLAKSGTGMFGSFQYPYTSWSGLETYPSCGLAADPEKQKALGMSPLAYVSGFVSARGVDADFLMNAVATVGPVAVNVAATGMHSYTSGVYDGCSSASPQISDINHVVVVVGYGTDKETGLDYWLVRNSWQAGFGEGGYIKMLRTKETQYTVDETPEDGVECANPSGETLPPVKIGGECGILYQVAWPLVA